MVLEFHISMTVSLKVLIVAGESVVLADVELDLRLHCKCKKKLKLNPRVF